MKRWAEIWSSFPAEHKKRCYQGLAAYALLAVAVAGWVVFHARGTVQDWQSRTPSATAVIRTVYLTPQITDVTPPPMHETIPVIAETPKIPPVTDDGKTYIVLIMSDLGLSALPTKRALNDLPPQVVLAFSPYAENLQTWIEKAATARRETLLQMPMETAAYPQEDPGPRALSSRFSDQDNNNNLNWLLTQAKGTIGVINLMGSRFMTDEKRLSAAFATLRKNNAIFVETPGITKSAGAAVAAKNGLPYLAANLQIDATATDKAIREQLAALEKTAHERGYAIGIAQPYPLTFNTIKSWADGLVARGIILAPLKTVWKNKPHYEEAPPQPSQPQLQQP